MISNSSCDKNCQTRIGKVSSVFGRLKSELRNRHISTTLKVRLYESLVMSTMLYGAELWPLTVAQKKKPEVHTTSSKDEDKEKKRKTKSISRGLGCRNNWRR